jgi:DNA polymerase I-like protein with 3'-5' exonuclease and polymerase domains
MSLDIETYDPQLKKLGIGTRRGGYILGFSLAWEDRPAVYFPIRHPEDNVDREKALAYLRNYLANFKGELIGANLGYDLDYLAEVGIRPNREAMIRDVQIAEPIINELRESYSLDSICKVYGVTSKKEEILRDAASAWRIDPKNEMRQLPGRYVAEYAAADAQAALAVYQKQSAIIDKDELRPIFDMESRLMPVLLRMRRLGVRISQEALERVSLFAREEAEKSLDKIQKFSGRRLAFEELWNAGAIDRVFKAVGISLPRTATKQPQVKADVLAATGHPIAQHVAEARQMAKVITTFVQSVKDHMTNGRLHCTYRQLVGSTDEEAGARFGRMSCAHPNLQQQPARHPKIAKIWRSIYIPEEGDHWATLDYSQQEPRMLVHYAEACGFPRASDAAERYRRDPNTDNHQMMADLCGIERKKAKIIFLGKCYGMGGAKLCKSLSLPTTWIHSARLKKMVEVAGPEGEAIIRQFDEKLPFVKCLEASAKQEADRRGYIRTILGRRCRFPRSKQGGFDWTHKALNRLIQGSSGDQTKQALIELDREGFCIHLQVHDEIDMSVPDRQTAERAADIMVNCVPLRVPSKVDVEIGPSWGEAV